MPSIPLEIQCRGGGAVSGVDRRPRCRDMPLYGAIRRSLERKLLTFLGWEFSFEPEHDHGGHAFRAFLAHRAVQELG